MGQVKDMKAKSGVHTNTPHRCHVKVSPPQ